MKNILLLLFTTILFSSCGTLFNITKKETEQEKWDRIINQAWEETSGGCLYSRGYAPGCARSRDAPI